MRDPALHDKRRRAGWDKAFTANSLRAYDSRVLRYADLLVDQIHRNSKQAINVTAWFTAFAFDVMGKYLAEEVRHLALVSELT